MLKYWKVPIGDNKIAEDWLRLQAKAKLRVSPTKTLALMKPLLMLDCILRLQAKAMLRLILLLSVMTCSSVLHGLPGVEDEVQGAVRLYK